MLRRTFRLTVLLLILVALFAVFAAPAAAQTFYTGNPTCTDIGLPSHIQAGDWATSGTFTLYGSQTFTLTVYNDSKTVDWSSTIGIDAVIVKAGNGANVYFYNEATSGTGLQTPLNDGGNQAALSHIRICYDYEVTVSKTANTTFTRTYQWSIDKSVFPDTLDMFTDDSGQVSYSVVVNKTGYTDSNWAVSGSISVWNNTPITATITSVSDDVSGYGAVMPNCGVTFPYDLAAGATLVCTYASALPDGSARTNTATVTTSGSVGGGSANAAITFGAPTTEVNATVSVTDSMQGYLGSASGYTAFDYSRTFTCDADEGKHDNTATINETGQSDSASVTVNCYELTVTKDASTSLTRTWDWTIAKSGDQTDLTLATGQSFLVNYEVIVSALSADSNWAVTGNIYVANNTPLNAPLTGVSDIISGFGGSVTVDCGLTFPYTLAAGATLACTYSAALPDAASRTNTATATLQNTPSGTTGFSGTANVSFGTPTVTQVDECINVSDDQLGSLGTVCADQLPKTYSYSLTVGPYAVCGDYTFTNIASFVTNDTASSRSDDHVVNITVPCAGCTLTQGYWKTHSDRGPAPYDSAWITAMTPLGEDTLFFNTGLSWYTVFWTPPAGNAFYNLAHQYMAAKLNILNGAATTPAVTSAIASAEALFASLPAGSITLTNAQTRNARNWASTLDQYNNGLIGPGHCDE
ncbi:MAG: hypothetical protein IPK17_30615 [Chloroflexi bacterium]|uniref:hypothetical protein n=1 Tax=Candidatus Flexifilum breve TaxID=3140694 RepID=UPI0031369521|nr:hypothetical protein [Chloroflexota bacterium]